MDRLDNPWYCGEIAVLPPKNPPRRAVDLEPHEIPVGEPPHRRVTGVLRTGGLAAIDQHDLVLEATDRGLHHIRGDGVALHQDSRRIEQPTSRWVGEQKRDPWIAPDVERLVRQADRGRRHELTR